MERELFDVVLMDVQMPVMGGIEATGLIREGQAGFCTRSTPVTSETTTASKAESEALDDVALMKLVAGDHKLPGERLVLLSGKA